MRPPDCAGPLFTRAGVLAASLVFLTLGCEGNTEPESGTLEIQVSTIGGDLDLDGYLLVVDGQPHGPVGLFTLVRLRPWPAGSHTVSLVNLDSNCELTRDPGTVTVQAGETTRAQFEVVCHATAIRVFVQTTGLDPDPNGYTVQVGSQVLQTFTAYGLVTASRLLPGTYPIEVSGLSDNCQATSGLSREVQVTSRQVVEVTFDFRCSAVTGIVEATVRTNGLDPDPDGYLVHVGTEFSVPIDANGSARLHQIPAGSHGVSLTALTPNCVTVGENPRSVAVTAGGFTRDTSHVVFEVSCGVAEKIGYVRDDLIHVVYSDGSNPTPLATSRGSFSWSPDGKSIVYEGRECYWGYYYYYNTCTDLGLQISSLVGQTGLALTNRDTDRDPAWSPDGSWIAFSRSGRLQIVAANGGTPQTLSLTGVIAATEPDWSPDGDRLAFTCEITEGNQDICAVNRDGTGFVRLTSTPWADHEPAWHPNGWRIAFTTDYNSVQSVVHMAPDGSDLRPVHPGTSPDWSPSGDRLVLVRSAVGLGIVNADGSGFRYLLTGLARSPEWRP